MPITIARTSVENYLDDSGGAYIKCLLLGEPGVGKTRSSSFWPDPIYAATENGLMSVADRRVPFVLIKSTSDLEQLIAQVKIECQKPPAERAYSTFVLDTMDAYQQKVAIPEVLKSQRHDSMQLADWGVLAGIQNRILNAILQLPMNVVVLCHAKANDDGDGPKTIGPALQGGLKDTIAAEFDLVGHMSTFYESVEGERTLRRAIKWHQDPRYPLLKDRSGQLPPFTGVDFSEDDYLTLRQLMFGDTYFEKLPATETVQTIADPPPPANVVAPAPGGPVAVKEAAKVAAKAERPAETATKRKVPAAKKAAAPEPTPEVVPAAAPVQEATPADVEEVALPDINDQTQIGQVPPTPEPAETTEEQAIATVEETLGATVIEQAPPAGAVKSPQLVGTACGTPARGVAPENAATGCGKDLGSEEMDYVNIAVMKFKTNLCYDCFQTARKAKVA